MKAVVTILVFCVAGLMSLGMVMLYSSGMFKAGAHYLLMQLIWGVVGIVACAAAASVDYQKLRKFVWPLFVISLVLLGLVLIPHVGIYVKGARRWLGYGPVRFQCSELAKLALVLALAWYGERFQRQLTTLHKGIAYPGLIIGAVLALIFLEPDRGTTILLAAVSGAMLLIAGVKWYALFAPVIVGIAGLAYSLLHDEVRSKRILSWMNLEESKSGVGYQAYQAMLALGAGGWTGLGLGNGKQKFGFIPEHHTDFILSMIGEELGVIATLLVVVGFIAIVVCGLYIAYRSPDTFGTLLAAGLTLTIGFQAAINIGVVTSALPNKGLPLPFISYGGSNLLMMLTSVGLLLSISRQARPLEKPAKGPIPEREILDENPFKAPGGRGRIAVARA